MLKQPLLSRMFKLKAADTKASASGETLVETTVDVTAEKPVAVAELTESATLAPEKKEAPEKKDPETADDSSAEGSSTEVVPAESATSQANVKKPDEKSKKLKLPQLTTTQAMMALGAMAAVTGAVVPRAMSPSVRASFAEQLAGPVAPVSSPGDPTTEPVVTTGNLLVTNQILYRKLEAIAGVTIVSPEDRVAPTLPVPSADVATAAGNSTDNEPTGSKSDASATAASSDKTEESEDTKPDPDVNVTAAAPPAPVADPVVFTGTTIDSVLEMRVAVAKDVSGIGFATSGDGVITDLDGNELKTLSPEVGVLAEDNGSIVIDGEVMPSAFWVYPEDGGYVAVGDSWYRGRMLIALRERGLIAVNYVLLGDYLYSVVGTEMSSNWPIESLKAQAVAARSYALTHNIHPASETYFDLDNTQRFQAYKGINREANTTQAAVQSTAGEFISYEDGIVESLYAASQAIVDDAHSGAGMSQLGAKDLAEQGYSYQEILAHYYPGTALGRLETDQ